MWSFIVERFKKLKLSLVPAVPALLFILVILINIAIWWTGPWLEVFGEKPLTTVTQRTVASGLFSLSVISIWGIWQWRQLVGYKSNQEKMLEQDKDSIKAMEECQEAELNQIMVSIKENINKRNYLYALPWYLVVGFENAGKTSLINRSGQNFTFSSVMRASGQKSENPYSFDWWIGDDSILIDPDGGLISQGNDSENVNSDIKRRLWLHFVGWLNKTRSRRPLNGIVLAVDVAHLSVGAEAERKAYANLLRARLRELMETLSTRLPVYVVLTKFDLMYGFEPFFKHYTRSQREEVFGFTFSLDSVNDLDYWLKEFNTDYTQFVENINALLPSALAEASTLEDRNALYSFTRQMSGLKNILHRFFEDTLSSDQFSTSALMRGAYFTSVYQQGVPVNAFDDASSRRYGLEHAANTAQSADNSTTYFTLKLFKNIIYPEAGLASDSFRVTKQKRRIMLLTVLVTAISTVLLVGTWHRYYLINTKHTDAVLTKVNEYQQEFALSSDVMSKHEMLGLLNKIREATLEFGFFRDESKYTSHFGLYQGHTIGPMVEKTYLNLLETRFLPLLMADVIVDLNSAKSDEEQLSVLRVYRMMVDKSGRYEDYVLDYFGKRWQRSFSGQRHVQEQLLDHLEYAMTHTDLAAERAAGNLLIDDIMKPYDEIIVRVQQHLGSMPNDQRVYRNLKLNAQTMLGPPINIRNLVGPIFDVVFQERVVDSQALYIPKMLTKEGFEDYFMPKSELVSELALIDSWVLSQSKLAKFSEADKQVLRGKIRDLYVADYNRTWRVALNEIDVKYFADINEAIAVLESLTSSVEPIQRLLRTLRNNTELFENLPKEELAKTGLMKSPEYKVAAMISTPFSELNSMLVSVEDKPAYFNEVLVAVEKLQAYLSSIQDAPDVGTAALDATKARIKLLNADPIYTLKRIASGLPKPLDSMMNKLADESWYVIKQEAIKHLEVRWHDDVYKVFEEKLSGRYPFDFRSKKDSALKDFEAFFAPNGILNNFYTHQLQIFIDENISTGEEGSGQTLIREEVLDQLKQAKKIQQAFFNRKGVLDVSFSMEPLRLSNNKRRSVLNIDGQYLTYSHGPRESVELIWPNTLRESAASKVTLIPTQSNASPRSINIQGQWAFFRLLDLSDVVAASPTSVDLKFSVDNGNMIYRLSSEADINPFTQRLFKSFKLSKTLY